MRILTRFASALLVLVLPAASWAVDLSGQSRTYLQYREATDSTKLLPLYEYLDFRAGDKSETFSFHFGGWYRYDLKDESFGKDKSTGDLQYAYLRYRSAKNNAYANLGRFVVNQGVASEHLDGAAAGTDLWGGFEISAYGGIPVETDFDSRSGDSLYGGSRRPVPDWRFLSSGKERQHRVSEGGRGRSLVPAVCQGGTHGHDALQRDHL